MNESPVEVAPEEVTLITVERNGEIYEINPACLEEYLRQSYKIVPTKGA